MGNYYYIIAGLPDISFDDSKTAYTVEQFRQEVYDKYDYQHIARFYLCSK